VNGFQNHFQKIASVVIEEHGLVPNDCQNSLAQSIENSSLLHQNNLKSAKFI